MTRPHPTRSTVLTEILDARLDACAASVRAARDLGADRWTVVRTLTAIAAADASAYDPTVPVEGVKAAVTIAEQRAREAVATIPGGAR